MGPGSVPSAPSAGSGTCARHSLQERAVRQSGLTPNKLQTALNSRILVEQAKGVLLASAGIDVDQAFKLMRDYSRRNRSTRQDRCPKRRQSGRDRRSAPPPLTPRIGRDGPAEVDPASR